ncbi:hypothetical protein [Anatilimnocola floriformis]|uniref:hypothetical protein n=1 Tax=Anatilimnocola floriformis TaxID=2948575 RepID=UPI0020C27ED7|nr:hypothetical protein [Anatilimnocola floriformis]
MTCFSRITQLCFLSMLLISVRAGASPVCALIDTSKLPVTALLEARLLASDNATWVERSQIDKLLAERELHAAFSAGGVEARSSLGALVKADVLVLLRLVKLPGPEAKSQIECVVCDTQGLRLRTMSIRSETATEATVSALEELIEQGLKKHAEKIETIVAVPPFLSEDLGFEFNYLQTAYAKLVEEQLLAQPGVLVVELGEAQAIAKELTLAGERKLARLTKPPLHVIGRYRHDGSGDSQTMRMSLRLLQSEMQLTLKGAKDLPPAEMPAWIVTKTGELISLLQTKEALAPREFSAADEAKALAVRGRQFQKVGNWAEALALHEASLLLAPEQTDVRRDAVIVSGNFIWSLRYEQANEFLIQQISLADRGHEHFEAYLRVVPKLKSELERRVVTDPVVEFLMFGVGPLRPRKDTPPELVELKAAAMRRCTETLLRIARFRADAGYGDRDEVGQWEASAFSNMPDEEQFAMARRLAREWEGVRELPERFRRMFFWRAIHEESPELRQLLDEFAASPRADLQATAEVMRRQLEKNRQNKAEIDRRRPPPEPTELDPRLELLTIKNRQRSTRSRVSFDGGWPAFPGMDVFSSNGLVAAMRTKGEWSDFYSYPTNLHISSVVFDGRYVWFAGSREPRNWMLVAIDAAGKSRRIFEPGRDARIRSARRPNAAGSNRTRANLRRWLLRPNMGGDCRSNRGQKAEVRDHLRSP